jgi:hypothetical protein
MKFPYLPQIHGKRYNILLFYICDLFLLSKQLLISSIYMAFCWTDLLIMGQAKNKNGIDTDIKKSSKFNRPVRHDVKVCSLCICQEYKLNCWFSLNMCCRFMF